MPQPGLPCQPIAGTPITILGGDSGITTVCIPAAAPIISDPSLVGFTQVHFSVGPLPCAGPRISGATVYYGEDAGGPYPLTDTHVVSNTPCPAPQVSFNVVINLADQLTDYYFIVKYFSSSTCFSPASREIHIKTGGISPPSRTRITEDGNIRITEDGNTRVTQ